MGTSTIENGIYQNLFMGRFGGTTEPGVVDPYVSGYGFLWFDTIPNITFDGISTNQAQEALAALFVSMTPPTVSLEKATQTGLGGLKFSAPTNITVEDNFTVKFLEVSGTPIYTIIHGWVQYIRDIRTGLANDLNATQKSDYSASAYYWTTKPDGQTIEQAWLFTGMFPTTDPTNLYTTTRGAGEKLEVDITFSFDNVWPLARTDPNFGSTFVVSKVESLIATILSFQSTWLSWSG